MAPARTTVEKVKKDNFKNISASKHKLVESKLKDRYTFENGLERNRSGNKTTAAATANEEKMPGARVTLRSSDIKYRPVNGMSPLRSRGLP